MERQVSLSSENFDAFIRCLSLFREPVCNDVDIRAGIIRQRTNDRLAIFEVDLTSLISDTTLPIVGLKSQFDLLNYFQEQEVDIKIDERSFYFSNKVTSFEFNFPEMSFIDNTFISDDDFLNLFTLDEDEVILQYTLPKTISDAIKIATSAYHVNSVQLLFEGETCSIITRTPSKDRAAKFVSGILVNKPMNASSTIVVTPFISDHDGDMQIKSYQISEKVCVTKFTMDVSGVPVSIFARSSLVFQE